MLGPQPRGRRAWPGRVMWLTPRRETIGAGLGPAALSACRETAHHGVTAKRPGRCIAEQAEGDALCLLTTASWRGRSPR
jgi:hypothetical protein